MRREQLAKAGRSAEQDGQNACRHGVERPGVPGLFDARHPADTRRRNERGHALRLVNEQNPCHVFLRFQSFIIAS